mmetsp:Transcript_13350/g.25063  ORF Transcript_13350/g.25063 Transcript_13350/m.25063 type:complete len:256 (-) Transcript_13350:600-1367(-)
MSDAERAPLIRREARAQVRAEVRDVVTRSFFASYILVIFSLCVSLLKIATHIIVFCLAASFCDKLLFIYVVGCLVMDVLYSFLQTYKLHHMRTRSTFPGEVSWVRHTDTWLALLYIFWQIFGNISFYTDEACRDDSDLFWGWALTLIILGYLYILLPILAVCCLCCCLPCLIVVMLLFNIGSTKKATERMLAALLTENYDPSKHMEPNCSICGAEFQGESQVCVMPCTHYYHEACIKDWLRIRANCPICRYELPE